MRYFGRSDKEKLDEYKSELNQIERSIFKHHLTEIIELLELASRARDNRDDEYDLHAIQRRITIFLHKLDALARSAIAKHLIKIGDSKG